MKMDPRAHSNRKLRFQDFCRSIRLIERVFWSFYSTVRPDIQYWLAFSWPYNLLSDKVLRITVYSCANAPAGPESPVVLRLSAKAPLAVLASPSVLSLSASNPMAVFRLPVVLFSSARVPRLVLFNCAAAPPARENETMSTARRTEQREAVVVEWRTIDNPPSLLPAY